MRVVTTRLASGYERCSARSVHVPGFTVTVHTPAPVAVTTSVTLGTTYFAIGGAAIDGHQPTLNPNVAAGEDGNCVSLVTGCVGLLQ